LVVGLVGSLLLWERLYGGPAVDNPKHVLILESFGRNVAPWSYATPVLKRELAQQCLVPIEFTELPLETARFGDAAAEKALAEYLRTLCARRPLDLVVPVGGAAAQFWARQRGAVCPAAPMLIGGIEGRVLQTLSLASNDAAVVVQFDLSANIELVLRVLPDTTNIALVVGNSPLEQFWAAQCRHQLQPFTNRVHFTWFNELALPEMCRRAAVLPPRSAIGYGMLAVDAAGVPHEEIEALTKLCAVANAPVFGLNEEQLGHGITGGPLFSSETLGRAAGRLAARMLNGEKPGNSPSQVIGCGPPTFDWRELQRWHISESRLPPGSIVRYRRPSPSERYRWYVVGALGVVLAQAVTIVGLLAQRIWRRRAELAAHQLRSELAHAGRVHALGQLSSALAHELNQPVTAILSNAQAAQRFLKAEVPDLEEVRGALEDIAADTNRASEVIRGARALVRRGGSEWRPLDLGSVIRNVAVLLRSDALIRNITLELEPEPRLGPVRGDPIQLQQVLLNLLLNAFEAMKDTGDPERRVTVRALRINAQAVRVAVADHGTGIGRDKPDNLFEPFRTTKPQGLGLGLVISRSIIEAHRGRLWAENNPDRGATFYFELPLAETKPSVRSDQ
jgi:signal transduction histidine kinase